MKCPACTKSLSEVTAGAVKVDACCEGCGGIWFDAFELSKLDNASETGGESLLDIGKRANAQSDSLAKRQCPKCMSVTMMQHFYSVKRQVVVDECPGCGGFWLDMGELATIRGEFATEEEARKAAQGYFSEHFDPQLDKMQQQSEEHAARAHKIARMFRFICPSYYIPGKQDWGAF